MIIDTPIKVNITKLKAVMPEGKKVEEIKNDLRLENAKVEGYKDEDGTLVMVISGNVDYERIEAVFEEDAEIANFNDYIIDDDDYDFVDMDSVDIFDNKNVKKGMGKVNEKKTGCCPPKKKDKKNEQMISLSEALNGTEPSDNKNVTLDNIIDNMTGKTINESVAQKALRKAKGETSRNFLMEKLGAKRYNMVMESLQQGKDSVYSNVKVNGKVIGEYTTEELEGLLEKVTKQIAKLEAKTEGLNEGDEVKGIREEIAIKKKVQTILDDEISFRNAVAAIKEDGENGFEFKNLNPNAEENDKKEEKNEDESSNNSDNSDNSDSSDDDNSDNSDDNDSDGSNPDEDEEVELSSVVITLASKESAEDLKNDLLDAGVPEDAIEIEPVEDEKDEENAEDEGEGESESSDNSEDNAEGDNSDDNTQQESVKTKNAKKVNEDDENGSEEGGSDEGSSDDNGSNDDSSKEGADDGSSDEGSDDNEEDGAYKLILTNTDYVPQLSDVLQDIWGMEKDEFEEMIGGEIVNDDDSSDEGGSDEGSSDDNGSSDNNSSDNGGNDDSSSSLDDFDPEEIFKGL